MQQINLIIIRRFFNEYTLEFKKKEENIHPCTPKHVKSLHIVIEIMWNFFNIFLLKEFFRKVKVEICMQLHETWKKSKKIAKLK